jgi:hypothetical protein
VKKRNLIDLKVAHAGACLHLIITDATHGTLTREATGARHANGVRSIELAS